MSQISLNFPRLWCTALPSRPSEMLPRRFIWMFIISPNFTKRHSNLGLRSTATTQMLRCEPWTIHGWFCLFHCSMSANLCEVWLYFATKGGAVVATYHFCVSCIPSDSRNSGSDQNETTIHLWWSFKLWEKSWIFHQIWHLLDWFRTRDTIDRQHPASDWCPWITGLKHPDW